MPKLGARKTSRHYLPSTKNAAEEDRAYVDVVEKFLLGEVADVLAVPDGLEQAIAGIARFISDWNYTNDDGAKLPINEENVRKMDMDDFDFLAGEFKKAMEAAESGLSVPEKKVSSASLTGADNPANTHVMIPTSQPITPPTS